MINKLQDIKDRWIDIDPHGNWKFNKKNCELVSIDCFDDNSNIEGQIGEIFDIRVGEAIALAPKDIARLLAEVERLQGLIK